MKILFVSSLSYSPQYYCGANISIDQLCKSFLRKGHKACVLVALRPGGIFAFISRLKGQFMQRMVGCKVSKDLGSGYPAWRAWFPWEVMDYVVKKEKPDVIIIVAGEIVRLALAAKNTGVPVCMGLTDVEFQLHGGDFKSLGLIPCIANSQFTARIYNENFGVTSEVVYPLFQVEKYRTSTTRENITFINPHPEKGCAIALEIAKRCPDIPFAFYRTWILSDKQESELAKKLAYLPNVKLFEAQKDMNNVYGKCKILLVPSVWEETYGRVATEAQLNGIPVIASTRGGLPEAVGPGGILIDPNGPIEAWVNAVYKLWHDTAYYAELSRSALAHAQRIELDINFQIDTYEQFLKMICYSNAPYNNLVAA